MNNKGQLDEINPIGIIGAVLGGLLSVFITHQMSGGIFLKIIGFFITAVVCYIVASKLVSD